MNLTVEEGLRSTRVNDHAVNGASPDGVMASADLDRQTYYLLSKLTPVIRQGLSNSDVCEIMLNPDGRVWFKTLTHGHVSSGGMTIVAAEAFVYAVAKYNEKFIHAEQPYLNAVLPFNGERFNATIPPISVIK